MVLKVWLQTRHLAPLWGSTKRQTPGPHPDPPKGNIWRWGQGICIFKKLLRWRETAAFTLVLCFLLKLLPFFFGEFIGNHSTFVHITSESLKPTLLSQTADLRHQIPANYSREDIMLVQSVQNQNPSSPQNKLPWGSLCFISGSLSGSGTQASTSFLLFPARDQSPPPSSSRYIHFTPTQRFQPS